jgi:hypothetical protein
VVVVHLLEQKVLAEQAAAQLLLKVLVLQMQQPTQAQVAVEQWKMLGDFTKAVMAVRVLSW